MSLYIALSSLISLCFRQADYSCDQSPLSSSLGLYPSNTTIHVTTYFLENKTLIATVVNGRRLTFLGNKFIMTFFGVLFVASPGLQDTRHHLHIRFCLTRRYYLHSQFRLPRRLYIADCTINFLDHLTTSRAIAKPQLHCLNPASLRHKENSVRSGRGLPGIKDKDQRKKTFAMIRL